MKEGLIKGDYNHSYLQEVKQKKRKTERKKLKAVMTCRIAVN